jgi:hypothetical protein
MVFRKLVSPLLLSTVLGGLWAGGAMAETLAQEPLASPTIEMGWGDEAFQNRELQEGPVRVSVDFTPKDLGADDAPNLFYRVYVNDRLVAEDADVVWMWGEISLTPLDQDGVPEVVFSTYTGGAHCCTIHTIHSWRGHEVRRTQTYPLDGGGGQFQDLDGDGTQEFITVDNGFLYAFSSYAGSFPPLLILSFQAGQWVDVTRQYPERQRSHAWRAYLLIRDGDTYEVNGPLAGYVAQKILLGEYREGWAFMEARYDRTDDWGLDIYEDGEVVGRYPDYPAALRALLIDLGYLTAEGRPNQQLDLSDRVIAETSSQPTTLP